MASELTQQEYLYKDIDCSTIFKEITGMPNKGNG